jgi:hypothetical protein
MLQRTITSQLRVGFRCAGDEMTKRNERTARRRAEMKALAVETRRVPLIRIGLAAIAAVSAVSALASLSSL